MFDTGFFIGDFSLRISLRSGPTMEAEKNVDTAAIEIINIWKKRESEIRIEVGLSMRQVYTQVYRAILDSLRFYQSH